MTKKSVALLLAKKQSKRLPNKNTLLFQGEPMFLWNLKKCLSLFDKVYVSSDDPDILKQAVLAGADPIIRGETLCGDVPNIEVYKHAVSKMKKKPDYFVAVQVNSPNVTHQTISSVKELMERGYDEVMTCHEDYSIYGSVWGLSVDKLKVYEDAYNPKPEILIVDKSVDIHTKEDYNLAIEQHGR